MLGGLVPLIGGAVSALGSFFGGKEQNQAAEQASFNQMAFQKEMSDTAHRREVVDLRAAGLNPILSARYGGSSTPAGASWTPVNVLGHAANSAVDAYKSISEAESSQRNTNIKEPLEKAAGYVSRGIDTVQAIIPSVSAAVQSAVATALDKVEEVKGTALEFSKAAGQTNEEAQAVVRRVREIVNQPEGTAVSSARQIFEVLFEPNVRGNFAGRPIDNLRAIAGIKDPILRRQASIALERQQIRKHNPSFSRHGFR